MMPLTFAKQGERNSIIKVGGKEKPAVFWRTWGL